MQFRRFNDKGIAALTEYLDALRLDPRRPVPVDLLDKPSLTQPLDAPIEAEPQDFATRMDFACWLHDAAKAAGSEIPRKDAGFWAWLTLALFDQVCPEKSGKRKVGELARYVPQFDNYLRRYRHLLATPYNVMLMHEDNPMRVALILMSPLSVLGEVTEQFASRQELISCPGTMALASHLFYDESENKRRKSASGKAARRLGKLLNQYQRTWDICIMDAKASASILPREFEKFRKAAGTE